MTTSTMPVETVEENLTNATDPSSSSGRPVRPSVATPRPMRPRGNAANVPLPAHRHLPNWVRRAHSDIAPRLGDLLQWLHDEPKQQVESRLHEMTEQISAGKFSVAWQYPQLVAFAEEAYAAQREQDSKSNAAKRSIDVVRRRAEAQLRSVSASLPPDVASRLDKSLRGATDLDGMTSVEQEILEASKSVQSVAQRRRSREIEKTRSRLARSIPNGVATDEAPQETWQDVLRRFAEQQGSPPPSDS